MTFLLLSLFLSKPHSMEAPQNEIKNTSVKEISINSNENHNKELKNFIKTTETKKDK